MFEFGPYQLDESGHLLRQGEREVPLQPRVFDLLVYLVRNRTRVVPKEELLDVLWRGVTVTDNSLQRAVSTLRGVLREGGMDGAVKSYSRNGYRFLFEASGQGDGEPAADRTTSGDALNAADRACSHQRWLDAASAYEAASQVAPLDGHQLDRWALALQCLGRPSDAIPVLTRSIAAHSQARDVDSAAAGAVALSTVHFERGEAAVAKGWIAHAETLLADSPASASNGSILWMRSRMAAAEGDPNQALALAEATYEFGRRHSLVRIQSLGLMYRGFYRLSLGDTHAGLADQDHAAALALSSKIDPMTGGVLYCNILWTCRTFGDWARADQWTIGYERFCADSGMQFSGSCRLHRAEVLGVHGSLRDAHSHVTEALSRLSNDAPWAVGDAHRVLGDIEAAIGNTEAALAAYDKAYALGWDAEPGHALLLLERGDPDAAYASLERSLIGQSWWTLQRQGILLANLAVVAAHAGHRDRAQGLIDDLAQQADRWPMPSIRALTNEASAVLARQDGKPRDALRRLHLARQLWTSIDSRFNAARLRILLSEILLELSDPSGAMAEIRAALAAADDLQSAKLKQHCMDLQGRMADRGSVNVDSMVPGAR